MRRRLKDRHMSLLFLGSALSVCAALGLIVAAPLLKTAPAA